ncbi:phosphoribosylanthranilate isomerase [Marinicella litoralis]|uniref:N-(5'-phosphoribosyl)anthranilate isomerase n=2 Tax=Marinicella litoralis TaxID=644220 RepID=A0A4R6XVB2_9GAMM|nr:phosphoribosylanthranilate isomerase [Marinicella litoralis]
MAVDAGADILGLVGHMPSGPGIISDGLAAEIAAWVPESMETFLLTSETTVAGILAHHRRVNSTALQLVDELIDGHLSDIKAALPEVKLVQVIHVINQYSVQQAQQVAQYVDALLLDSGNPNAVIKELGGTGRVHNWQLSKDIVDSVDLPVYLAGGLNHSNVSKAVAQVKPHGLDLCSSVRTHHALDVEKLSEFINQVKSMTVN